MTQRKAESSSSDNPPPESWPCRYRAWLDVLAQGEIHCRFQGKFSASDVVQQTLMHAWRDREQCRADDEKQRMAWMRQILAHQLAQLARHYGGTQQRDVSKEVSLDDSLACSSQRLGDIVSNQEPTPSEIVMEHERQLHLSDVLDRLSTDDRLVIVLRNLQELSYQEIATRMNRSEGAVRVLWLRALQRLKKEMKGD